MSNDPKERKFDDSTPSTGSEESRNSKEEAQHHFEADLPKTPRKESRRGGFGADFVPRRESAGGRESVRQEGSAALEGTTPTTTETTTVKKKSEEFRLGHFDKQFEIRRLGLLLLLLVPLTLFSFFPALKEMVWEWYTKVDYRHGFFVIPLVTLFLYLRADTYPGTRYGVAWIGLIPIALCCWIRWFAAEQYMDGLDQWSMLLWFFGVVWFFYGTRVFLWALPSLSFLVFMFPLPFRIENILRQQLQQYAAQLGAILLQLMGEPAIPIKNTIRLSTEELSVEAACSGIRFLISILAIAFATILVMRRPWWQNIIIVLIAAPLALFVNAARIAMTGIMLLHFRGFLESITPDGQNPSVIADDIAGIVMIFVAFGVFFAFLYYMSKVFRRVEI